VFGNFGFGEAVEFVGKDEPLVGFVEIEVGLAAGLVFGGFVPRGGDANIGGKVAAHFALQALDDGFDAVAAGEYVVNE